MNRGCLKYLFDKNNINLNNFIKDINMVMENVDQSLYLYGKGSINIFNSLKNILKKRVKLNSICRKGPCYSFSHINDINISKAVWNFQLNIFLISGF